MTEAIGAIGILLAVVGLAAIAYRFASWRAFDADRRIERLRRRRVSERRTL